MLFWLTIVFGAALGLNYHFPIKIDFKKLHREIALQRKQEIRERILQELEIKTLPKVPPLNEVYSFQNERSHFLELFFENDAKIDHDYYVKSELSNLLDCSKDKKKLV